MIKWSFCPKIKISYNGIFLQLVKYVDHWPNISPMVCLPWWICIHFWKCASFPISYGKCSKFQVILKYVHYFMIQSIVNLNFILYIIYIVPTLHVVKNYSWNLYILKIQMQ
jgi:hypothetical protein